MKKTSTTPMRTTSHIDFPPPSLGKIIFSGSWPDSAAGPGLGPSFGEFGVHPGNRSKGWAKYTALKIT
jgi:hypothetical protein